MKKHFESDQLTETQFDGFFGERLQPSDNFDNAAAKLAEGVDIAVAQLESVLKGEASFTSSPVIHVPELQFAPEPADVTVEVMIDHNEGCCCAGCGGMRPADDFEDSQDEPIATEFTTVDPGTPTYAGVPATLSELADYLTDGYWSDAGTVSRKYNMTSSGLNAKSGVLHYNVSGFTNASVGTDINGISTARADLVRDVLDVYTEVLGITFVETTSSDETVTDLFFSDNQTGAYCGSAGYSAGLQFSVINVEAAWYGGLSDFNTYTVQTFFHEIGHALGLGHQGLYNGTGDYATDAEFETDSWQASMMSYFSQTDNTVVDADFAFLQTPMAVDWIALDNIYGTQSYNGTTFGIQNAFTGDTVYGFNTNISASVSEIWNQFSTYADVTASTIVDAGGIDTVDFSGYSADQLINLTETDSADMAPSISNIGGLVGNLTLAEGTVIENAIGGSGSDTFYGNSASNTFTGNAGNDLFYSSDGSDTYYGGSNTDTISYAAALAAVGVRLDGTAGWGAAAGDVIYDVENLIGSEFSDTLVGSDLANTVEAGDGDDTIYAKDGDDTIVGGQGADQIYGQGGSDTASYADATQGVTVYLDGSAGSGGALGDQLYGVENLVGSDYDDTFELDGTANAVDGGTGTNTVSYDSATQAVGIKLDGSVGWGGATGDTMSNVQNLIGSDFADTLVGDDTANVIEGGDGGDTIYAKGGDDTILGGLGADAIYGQGGSDTASYADATQGVVISLDGTAGTGGAAGDTLIGIENLIGSDFDDTFSLSSAANAVDGGAGTNTVSYADASQAVGIKLDGSAGWGGATGDTMSNVQNLTGSDFADTLVGDTGANVLLGGDGSDTIYGREGADIVNGGAGDDTLYGQAGDDTFVFEDGFGNDVISSFAATNDNEKLDLSGLSTIADYNALTSNGHMSQVSSDVVIDDLSGNTITLLNVMLGDLDSNDFAFI